MLVFIRKGEDFPHGHLKLPEGRLKPPARIPRVLNAELLVVFVEPWVITPRPQDTTCNNRPISKLPSKPIHLSTYSNSCHVHWFLKFPWIFSDTKLLEPLQAPPSPEAKAKSLEVGASTGGYSSTTRAPPQAATMAGLSQERWSGRPVR